MVAKPRRPKKLLVLNEMLMLGSLRQHELLEATNILNVQLQKEVVERRSAEAALRDSEAQLRKLNADLEKRVLKGSLKLGRSNLVDAIESLDHSLVLYDSADRLVLFNRHLFEHYPLAREHFVVGRTFEQILHNLVGSGAMTVPPGQTAEKFIADVIVWHGRADGAVREVVEPNGRILHASEHRSQSHGVVSVVRDVTKQLELAEQLRSAQKMEAIGRLTGGLAHDLNNYLAVIIGNLDLLADSPSTSTDAPQLFKGAMEAALRGAELIASLLAVARRQPLEAKVIDVAAHVSTIIKMLERTIGEDIVIDLHVVNDLWPVKIDAAQLDTCIVNLANNARDAMPAGGKFSVRLSNVVAGAARTTGEDPPMHDCVLMEFIDTGVGMGKKVLERIFEPFFSTKEPARGSGLGLSMAHGFVHQSGGTIFVRSKPGEGTLIRILLPRALDVGVDLEARTKIASSPHGRERILLVEDNMRVRATAAAMLGSLGYGVTGVDSGDAALALLEQNGGAFDLMFSDIVMPGRIDGLELARLVFARWPSIRILMTSGFSEGAAFRSVETEKGLTVLRKPYRKAALARAIRTRLNS